MSNPNQGPHDDDSVFPLEGEQSETPESGSEGDFALLFNSDSEDAEELGSGVFAGLVDADPLTPLPGADFGGKQGVEGFDALDAAGISSSAEESGLNFADLTTPVPAEPELPAVEAAVAETKPAKKDKKAKKEKPAKKAKKEKPPKEKKPPKERVPGPAYTLGAWCCLGAAVLLLLAMIAVNVLIIMNPPNKGEIWFLGLFDLSALMIVLVPFLFWRANDKLSLGDIVMGLSLTAVSLGAILVLCELYRYDFMFKP